MLSIQKAQTDNDFLAIADLADDIWHEHYASIITKEQIDYMVNEFQSCDAIKKSVAENGYVYYMAMYNGKLYGYLGIHNEGDGVIFISKVYVHKDMRKKGIASSLLKRLLNDYPDAKKWYLTVNKYNSNSIAAYKKCGFITTRELVTDIGNGFVMDDYVMEKLL